MTNDSIPVTLTPPAPFSWDALSKFKQTPFPPDYSANVRRFYSPQDNVKGAFMSLVASATSSLLVSMYGEDDPDLTALIVKHAVDPKVFVQVNLDKTQAAGKGEIPLVAQLKGCPATRLAIGTSRYGAINHLKMAVIDGLYTLSGSTNWSTGGEAKQNNEASILMGRAEAHEASIILTLEHQEMLAQMARAAATA